MKNLNIIVGKNDCGKSNLLKALNLFFNNEINDEDEFDFLRDLTKGRAQEARSAKGRAQVWIKIHFNNTFSWKSLPKSFWVKRSWNRYSETPDQAHTVGIPESTLSRFFNKIEYRYVPAVRDESVFEYYISALFDILQEQGENDIRENSAPLVDIINQKTSSLSGELFSLLGFKSNISFPTDLHHLFATLDFSTMDGDTGVSFRQRGDGVQTRHIPSILHFISEKSSKTDIWGFEEPENSLEMSIANELAITFKEKFSKIAQIFATTYSPSFYSLDGAEVSKWGVIKKYDSTNHVRSIVKKIDSLNYWDGGLGLLPEVSRLMKPKLEELAQMSAARDEIQAELSLLENNLTKPLLFVEGETDKSYLEAVDGNSLFDIISANNAEKAVEAIKLLAHAEAGMLGKRKAALAIIDNDDEVKHFDKLSRVFEENIKDGIRYKKHKELNLFVAIIPHPSGLENFLSNYPKVGTAIEHLIETDIWKEGIESQNLVISPYMWDSNIAGNITSVNLQEEARKFGVQEDESIKICKVRDNCKVRFSAWVCENHSESLDQIKGLVNVLFSLCDGE